jgi:GT2 family glycosyltransferase
LTIAANIIVGPWEEPFLNAALLSILDLVDEFVVIDTAPGNNPNRDMLNDWMQYSHIEHSKPFKIIDMARGEDKDFSFSAARELARVNTMSDWILKFDADECIHENDIPTLLNAVKNTNASAIQVNFYHFMLYPNLYQFIDKKTLLFKRDKLRWINDVHELPEINGLTEYLPITYFHYGYLRGQEEVYKRWVLYRDIEGKPAYYDNMDPKEILTCRLSVCQNFIGEHPLAVQGVLAEMFKDMPPFQVKDIPRYIMSDNYVGLLLITYNDEENLAPMLQSLAATVDYPTIIYHIDMGSTDCSAEIVPAWFCECKNDMIKECTTVKWDKLESLSYTMNIGFAYLMGRQECSYIGWAHSDMKFEYGWLSQLVAYLKGDFGLGKACSFNTRDGFPQTEELIDGHEQCYLIPKNVLLQIGLFNEEFIGIGGFEDWCLNNRIRKEGFRVVIVPTSLVYHKGMGTREKRDTTAEQIYNRVVYQKIWGTTEEWINFE